MSGADLIGSGGSDIMARSVAHRWLSATGWATNAQFDGNGASSIKIALVLVCFLAVYQGFWRALNYRRHGRYLN